MRYYFTERRDGGIGHAIHDLLRWQVWEKARRKADPSLAVLDTQSVTWRPGSRLSRRGVMRQETPGRKHGLAVDVLGLVIAVVVLEARCCMGEVAPAVSGGHDEMGEANGGWAAWGQLVAGWPSHHSRSLSRGSSTTWLVVALLLRA